MKTHPVLVTHPFDHTSCFEDDPHRLLEYWSLSSTPAGRTLRTFLSRLKKLGCRAVTASSHFLKRFLDILVSALALLALSPLFATVILLIKLEDNGPAFFCQQRVGKRGRIFRMWKFRSMVRNAEALKTKLAAQNEMAGGVIFKMKNDPRITRIGKWIRKFSIDEMPQLWNVLKGEMSLVGPRPPVPKEVEEYSVEDRQRLLATPGLTCFWQVGGRSNIDFAGQVRLDLAYIRAENIWLDLKLMFLTIPAVVLGKGAY